MYEEENDIMHMWLMVGQKSAKCDPVTWRVPVTLENAFFEEKTQRDPRDQRDPVTRDPRKCVS